MLWETDDLRIEKLQPLIPPAILMEEYPVSEEASEGVSRARAGVSRCLHGKDRRLVVVVGPCSIHDPESALEYGRRLREQAGRFANELLVIMRVYFEKPRTTVGWKGLINDPDLDGSFHINKGLRSARRLLLELNNMGLPAGCEFLDTIMPQFFADLVSWGAIGARTTESQVHRELASGMSCPMGFKNGTDGNIRIAADAVTVAARPHHFLSVTKQGVAAIVATRGNRDCHVILRGSTLEPNYGEEYMETVGALLRERGVDSRIMVDCSHGNVAGASCAQQAAVVEDLCRQIDTGQSSLFGVMLESNLAGGSQDIAPRGNLTYGQSVTDACLSWDETVPLLEALASVYR